MENELSPQQSLDIITAMINQSKINLKRSSFYFLLWGWIIMFCNLSIYVMLSFFNVEKPFWVWVVTIPTYLITIIYSRTRESRGSGITHLEGIARWLWVLFGIICFTLVAVGSRINWQINPVIITLSAIPTFLSGVLFKFRPLKVGGILFWLVGIVLFFLPINEQFLMAAIAIGIGYLVPGYLLRSTKD